MLMAFIDGSHNDDIRSSLRDRPIMQIQRSYACHFLVLQITPKSITRTIRRLHSSKSIGQLMSGRQPDTPPPSSLSWYMRFYG
jgi:hypothetical protein